MGQSEIYTPPKWDICNVYMGSGRAIYNDIALRTRLFFRGKKFSRFQKIYENQLNTLDMIFVTFNIYRYISHLGGVYISLCSKLGAFSYILHTYAPCSGHFPHIFDLYAPTSGLHPTV